MGFFLVGACQDPGRHARPLRRHDVVHVDLDAQGRGRPRCAATARSSSTWTTRRTSCCASSADTSRTPSTPGASPTRSPPVLSATRHPQCYLPGAEAIPTNESPRAERATPRARRHGKPPIRVGLYQELPHPHVRPDPRRARRLIGGRTRNPSRSRSARASSRHRRGRADRPARGRHDRVTCPEGEAFGDRSRGHRRRVREDFPADMGSRSGLVNIRVEPEEGEDEEEAAEMAAVIVEVNPDDVILDVTTSRAGRDLQGHGRRDPLLRRSAPDRLPRRRAPAQAPAGGRPRTRSSWRAGPGPRSS